MINRSYSVKKPCRKYYTTEKGTMYQGDCVEVIQKKLKDDKFDLLFTSPPFPLNRTKEYGNMTGEEYIKWFMSLSEVFSSVLSDTGSIVIEIGNVWEKGLPVHSTLPMEALLAFKNESNLSLCEEFIYFNPARLPAPIEWVNKKRVRVKDSFSRIWWLSKTPYPKANNRNVLEAYSKQMMKLINSGKYNSGARPSEYVIGNESFSKDNGGAIPANVLVASNTVSNSPYISYCKANNYTIHPARMPKEIVEFFVKFLTDENDSVLDPFSGSNTTGCVCERLNRRWIGIEKSEEYILGSIGNFSKVKRYING